MNCSNCGLDLDYFTPLERVKHDRDCGPQTGNHYGLDYTGVEPNNGNAYKGGSSFG